MKKILLIILTFVFVSLLTAVPVLAQTKQQIVILPQNETVNHDYFASGNQVEILGTIDGDAYIAGGTVMVNGTVNGDLLAAGGNVTITGRVSHDVRAGGGNVTFSGAEVGGNVTAGGGQVTVDKSTKIAGSFVGGGGNIQILGPVGRGLTIGGGNVTIEDIVGGDILAGAGQLSLAPNAVVKGNLTYFSNNKANISAGATVSGNIKQEIPPQNKQVRPTATPQNAVKAFVGFFLVLKVIDTLAFLIVGLLLILLTPRFMLRTSDFARTKFGWSLLFGFVALIATPVIGVILFVTILGIPLAVLLFVSYLIILWFAKIFSIYALGRAISGITKTKLQAGWIYLLGVVIYFILTLIPVIGFFTEALVLLSGLGAYLAIEKDFYTELRTKKLI